MVQQELEEKEKAADEEQEEGRKKAVLAGQGIKQAKEREKLEDEEGEIADFLARGEEA